MYTKYFHFFFQYVTSGTVPDVQLPTGTDIPRNQSKVVQPSKAELVTKHQTRMKHRKREA